MKGLSKVSSKADQKENDSCTDGPRATIDRGSRSSLRQQNRLGRCRQWNDRTNVVRCRNEAQRQPKLETTYCPVPCLLQINVDADQFPDSRVTRKTWSYQHGLLVGGPAKRNNLRPTMKRIKNYRTQIPKFSIFTGGCAGVSFLSSKQTHKKGTTRRSTATQREVGHTYVHK